MLNRTRALDVRDDMLDDGQRSCTRQSLDDGHREGLAIAIGTSLPGARVAAVLDQLVAIHGAPRALRVDNGPGLSARALTDWCGRHVVVHQRIQPGKPERNTYIERFHRTYRREVRDACACSSLAQVSAETETWRAPCITERPHDSLGGDPTLILLPRPTMPFPSDCQLSA